MRWLVLLGAVAAAAGAAACDCSLEQYVSETRGIREATGAAGVRAVYGYGYSTPPGCHRVSGDIEIHDCALAVTSPDDGFLPDGGKCWLSARSDPRGTADELLTWLELECSPEVKLVFPVPDLRTVEDGQRFEWPIVRGAPGKGPLPESAWIDTAEYAFAPCARNEENELSSTARIAGTVELVERTGEKAGGGGLVTDDFRAEVIVRAEFDGAIGRSGCTAAPAVDLSLRFVQTADDYGTENAACK